MRMLCLYVCMYVYMCRPWKHKWNLRSGWYCNRYVCMYVTMYVCTWAILEYINAICVLDGNAHVMYVCMYVCMYVYMCRPWKHQWNLHSWWYCNRYVCMYVCTYVCRYAGLGSWSSCNMQRLSLCVFVCKHVDKMWMRNTWLIMSHTYAWHMQDTLSPHTTHTQHTIVTPVYVR